MFWNYYKYIKKDIKAIKLLLYLFFAHRYYNIL